MSHESRRSLPRADQSGFAIEPANLKGKILPYNYTIFSARLPSTTGGKNSDLIINPLEGIFKGFSGHCRLFDISLLGDSVDLLRPGDICRMMVYDEKLPTFHSISERNWFNALVLRPVYHAEPAISRFPQMLRREIVSEQNTQQVMEPQDTRALIKAALQKDPIFIQELSSRTFKNDFYWLSTRPDTILKDLLASLERNIT